MKFSYTPMTVAASLSASLLLGSFYIIQPGERGIVVTAGKVPTQFSSEGIGFKLPLLSKVERVSIRQQTQSLVTTAFSADLQQLNISLKILYRVPESSVISIYQQYAGNPFDSLITPRVQEALKEVTALSSAEDIARKREVVKAKTLELTRVKVGDILFIEDVVIENISLSKELEDAIEAKMVQEQEAAKAKFTQQKAEIEAQTAVIRADGEAKAISVRGAAIRANPGLVELMIAEKWDGHTPMVVGSGSGANVLLPIGKN